MAAPGPRRSGGRLRRRGGRRSRRVPEAAAAAADGAPVERGARWRWRRSAAGRLRLGGGARRQRLGRRRQLSASPCGPDASGFSAVRLFGVRLVSRCARGAACPCGDRYRRLRGRAFFGGFFRFFLRRDAPTVVGVFSLSLAKFPSLPGRLRPRTAAVRTPSSRMARRPRSASD